LRFLAEGEPVRQPNCGVAFILSQRCFRDVFAGFSQQPYFPLNLVPDPASNDLSSFHLLFQQGPYMRTFQCLVFRYAETSNSVGLSRTLLGMDYTKTSGKVRNPWMDGSMDGQDYY
jgi:hypothetical protein